MFFLFLKNFFLMSIFVCKCHFSLVADVTSSSRNNVAVLLQYWAKFSNVLVRAAEIND